MKFGRDLGELIKKHGIGVEGDLALSLPGEQVRAKLYVQHNGNPENEVKKKLTVDF